MGLTSAVMKSPSSVDTAQCQTRCQICVAPCHSTQGPVIPSDTTISWILLRQGWLGFHRYPWTIWLYSRTVVPFRCLVSGFFPLCRIHISFFPILSDTHSLL
uniref:Uncharacterized protein n=1 Tax=Anguilla anguilla TaxID=7936 RepID=A0A0E9WQX5_ANGAN